MVYCQIFYEDNKRPALFADPSLGRGESGAFWFTTEIDPLWRSIRYLEISESIILLMHVHHFIELLLKLQISDDHFRSSDFFPGTRTRRTSTSRPALLRRRRVLQTSKRHLVIWLSCGFPDLSPTNVVWRHSSHIGGKVTMFVTVIGSVLCYDLSRRDLLVQLKQFVTDIKSS